MDKSNVVAAKSGILFSSENEGSADTCDNEGQMQKHGTKRKKQLTEDQILHDFIYMEYSGLANVYREKAGYWLNKIWGVWLGSDCYGLAFWENENVVKLAYVMVAYSVNTLKNLIVYFKWVNFFYMTFISIKLF